MGYGYITNPENEFRQLALAYIKAQDLSGLTPEEILDMYDNALYRIWKHHGENL